MQHTQDATEQPHILILTSKTGGGHISLAESLRDRLAAQFDCAIVDPQPRLIHTHYRLVSRYALWLWQAEYRFGDNPQRARTAHKLFTRLLATPLTRLLARTRPRVIISTYALYTGAMHAAIQATDKSIAAAVLLADPQKVHAAWLAVKTCDCVLAPTRETEEESLAAGFARAQVHLSGWPVRRQFFQEPRAGAAPGSPEATWGVRPPPSAVTRRTALQELGLAPERFTVFVQGGGEGAARFTATVEALLATNRGNPSNPLQIILATGTNARLAARFAHTPHVYALPFTKEIAAYMALGDVIMGKAGPNMLFESVTLGKPFIATTYIPGQETPNLDFIRRHRLGWVALDPREQSALLHALRQDPAQLSAQTAAVGDYRRWNLAQLATLTPQLARLAAKA